MSTRTKPQTSILHGPYRATKLWNEVVRVFCTELPVGKHRRHVRMYENCFTAAEAIDWLHHHLRHNPNFGPSVTRNQAILLLKKFYKNGIIEDVRNGTSKQAQTKSEDFKDNGDLYRFVQTSPLKNRFIFTPSRIPFGQQTNAESKPQDHSKVAKSLPMNSNCTSCQPSGQFGGGQLTVLEVENTWKDVVLKKLRDLLFLQNLDSILDLNTVSGRTILHNATKVDKNGIVTILNKTEDLPHWILSAMKCLANWPSARGTGSCLPNYPGFEQDVFRVIKEYFLNLEEPITTFPMYHALTSILLRTEYLDIGYKTQDNSNNCTLSSSQIIEFESMENLMLGMASKIGSDYDSLYSSHKSMTSTPVLQQNKLSTNPFLNPTPVSTSHSKLSRFPQNACYETAFVTASPVTRIVHEADTAFGSVNKSHLSYITLSRPKNFGKDNKHLDSYRPKSTMSFTEYSESITACAAIELAKTPRSNSVSAIPAATNANRSFRDLRRHGKNHAGGGCNFSSVALGIESVFNNALNLCDAEDLKNNSGGYINLGFGNRESSIISEEFLDELRDAEEEKKSQLNVSGSSYYTAHSYQYSTPSLKQSSQCTLSELDHQKQQKSEAAFLRRCSFLSKSENSVNKSPNDFDVSSNHHKRKLTEHLRNNDGSYVNPVCLRRYDSSPNLFTENGKKRAIEVFQLCLLLLPTSSRRKLHLLIQMMNRISSNLQLQLDSEKSNRYYVLGTFSRSILRPKHEADYDELVALRLVSFCMDYQDDIFKFPDQLRSEVQLHLLEKSKYKRQQMTNNSTQITYCEQVSIKTYEQQKMLLSQEALLDLLRTIITDPKLDKKHKKKKLKQFKENYPDIYAKYFPAEQQKTEVPKQRISLKSLHKFRSFRM